MDKTFKKEVAKNILLAIGIVGVLSVAVIAPGLVKILPALSKVDIKRINQELKRLKRRGLLEIIKKENGITEITLTKEGKEKLKRFELDSLRIERPKKWDSKWRIVIFDISIKRNRSRDYLRKKMKNLGFYKLQSSVFVYPFPCLDVVEYLRTYLGVASEVEYIEAERLESQDKLMKHFFVGT